MSTMKQKTKTKQNNKEKVSPDSITVLGNGGGIAKSQQLTSKLQKRKKTVRAPTKRKKVKLCGDDVIMPSLEDLEKMYADPDSECVVDKSYDTLPNKTKENKESCKSAFNSHSVDRANKEDSGSDSDSTVSYEVPYNYKTNVHKFSPLPSTSKDRGIFLENDKRLNASSEIINPENYLKPNGKVLSSPSENENNSKDENKIIETIEDETRIIETIEDETKIIETIEDKTEIIESIKDETKIIETVKDGTKIIETIVIDDDGYYVSIKNKPILMEEVPQNTPCSPIVIDDDCDDLPCVELKTEYSSVNANNTTEPHFDDCEIVNVDDVIATNNAVLEKYRKYKKINNVTQVELDLTVNNLDNELSDVRNEIPEINSLDANNSRNTSRMDNISGSNANPCNIPPSVCILGTQNQNKLGNGPTVNSTQTPIIVNDSHNNVPLCSSQSNHRPNILNLNNLISTVINHFASSIPKTSQNMDNNTCMSQHLDKFITEIANRKSSTPAKKSHQSSPMRQPPQRRGFGDCPICMDALADQPIVATVCGHVFCKHCIEAAIRSSGKRCPTCRMSLKKAKSYHQLFV